MAASIAADVCVIGAGSAGLSVAAGASQMGAEVVLIESGEMGGDCLNVGCVPSKSLLAAGHAAQSFRDAGRFGVGPAEPAIDFARVHGHVRGVIDAIAPVDSQERYEGFGVTVLRARARFADRRAVVTDAGDRIDARRVVIATGSRPTAPPVPGLERVRYLTNETVFGRTALPDHLVILGGGPIGCEMALAHRRLGARVTLVSQSPILPKDDPELTAVLRRALLREGVTLHETVSVTAAEPTAAGVALAVETDGRSLRVEGGDLLVAAGRTPALDDLDLEQGGVVRDEKGVTVDRRLKSVSNPHVFAAGDCAGQPQFTHVAGYHASVILRQLLFRLPAKVDYKALPRVTYTDPELAQVGLTEKEARDAGFDPEILRSPFEENDRARAERRSEGLAKVVLGRRGRILGAGVVGPRAGEVVQTFALAVHAGLKIGTIATMIAPYPTLGEIAKRAAGTYYAPRLFTDRTRRIVRLLARFG